MEYFSFSQFCRVLPHTMLPCRASSIPDPAAHSCISSHGVPASTGYEQASCTRTLLHASCFTRACVYREGGEGIKDLLARMARARKSTATCTAVVGRTSYRSLPCVVYSPTYTPVQTRICIPREDIRKIYSSYSF
jgi:hypothetical protein